MIDAIKAGGKEALYPGTHRSDSGCVFFGKQAGMDPGSCGWCKAAGGER